MELHSLKNTVKQHSTLQVVVVVVGVLCALSVVVGCWTSPYTGGVLQLSWQQ